MEVLVQVTRAKESSQLDDRTTLGDTEQVYATQNWPYHCNDRLILTHFDRFLLVSEANKKKKKLFEES